MVVYFSSPPVNLPRQQKNFLRRPRQLSYVVKLRGTKVQNRGKAKSTRECRQVLEGFWQEENDYFLESLKILKFYKESLRKPPLSETYNY